MPHTRYSSPEDQSHSKLLSDLAQYKENLRLAIKEQLKLDKQKKSEEAKFLKEREEKTTLVNQMKALRAENAKLAEYAEQLENDLIRANEQINALTQALGEFTAASLENNPANAQNATEAAVVDASKNTNAKETATSAPEASASYSMFNPLRMFYKNSNPAISQENEAHSSLADLTKASVDKAEAEAAAGPGLTK